MYQAGFIGCGNMGGALAAAAAKSGASILAADHNEIKLDRLRRSWGICSGTSEEVARNSAVIFLGVKPQAVEQAASEIRDTLAWREDHFVVVSMAAGLTLRSISSLLGDVPVIRIMPNTPAAVGEGVVLWCAGEGVTPEDETAVLALLRPAGLLLRVDESKLDAAGAVSGCGPAFACLFLEALTDGGVRCGLPRAQAEQLALQTVLGTAKLAQETRRDPALLRGEVCSPAGSTIEGVAVLENRAVRGAVIDAVTASYRRTAELGKR